MTFLFALRCLATNVLIDNTPTREPAEVSVVDEEVGVDLAAHIFRVAGLFRIRAIDCIRWDTLAFQEFHGLIQFLTMAIGPQDDAVPVSLQHLQRLNRKWHGLADGWISVFHHGAVKIDCNEQALIHHLRC